MEDNIINKKEDLHQKFNYSLNESLILNFAISNCNKNIYYKIEMKNEDDPNINFDIFETEQIKCEKENSVIEFSKKLNCNYFFNKRQKIMITVKKAMSICSSLIYKKYDRLTILSSLITAPDCIYERSIKGNDPDCEKIIIRTEKYKDNNSILDEISLFDFFNSGIKLSCYISLDFSNGNNPYINREIKNNFENIIKNISNIILNYTLNYSIFLYGLGGKLNIEDNFKEVFNINKNEIDASINSIDKMLESFNNCTKDIIPDNKIYLSPLLDKVNNEINNLHEVKNYNILFILLKDNIYNNDIKSTIDAIIESSYLPLTIIIIGVGNSDFDEMKNIFNSIPDTGSNRIKKYRNNVLFLSLNTNYENNLDNFIESCLKKIVIHMMNYYELIKCTPNQIKKGNFENINKSFNSYNDNINKSKNICNPELIFNKINESLDEFDDNSNSEDKKNENEKKNENANENEKKNENKNEKFIPNKHIDESINIKITGNPFLNTVNDQNTDQNIDQNNKNKDIKKDNPIEIPEQKYVNEKPILYSSINEDSINPNIKNNNIINNINEGSINPNINNNNEINNIYEDSMNQNKKYNIINSINEDNINQNIKNNNENNINDEKDNNNCIKIKPSDSIYEANLNNNPYCQNIPNENIQDNNDNKTNKFIISNSSTSVFGDCTKNYNPYSGDLKLIPEDEEIKSTYNSDNYKESNNNS